MGTRILRGAAFSRLGMKNLRLTVGLLRVATKMKRSEVFLLRDLIYL